jgi:hypothetical protein
MYRFRYTATEYEEVQTEEKLKTLMELHDRFIITEIDEKEKE